MKRLATALLALLLIFLLVAAAALALAVRRLEQPYGVPTPGADPVVFEIPPGWSVGRILAKLEQRGVIKSARVTGLYHRFARKSSPLRAGEYEIALPISASEVLTMLAEGRVRKHVLTIIEGLSAEETAQTIADQGFGSYPDLLQEMKHPKLIADLDPAALDLEGYLFPDTYHLPKGLSAQEIVAQLVKTFRQKMEGRLLSLLDGRDLRELVTLASVVEKETSRNDERPLVAGVYANRLRQGIALYADPTIIYALKKRGTWDGNLRRADLQLDSPYNTYRNPGLPPGPICSPGLASLLAAARPAEVPYLYFVSRNDGSHVFAATLAEHNRNVEEWQRRYWRNRWQAEQSKP